MTVRAQHLEEAPQVSYHTSALVTSVLVDFDHVTFSNTQMHKLVLLTTVSLRLTSSVQVGLPQVRTAH